MHKFSVVLICPTMVQEKLLDVLLENDETEIFTCSSVSCHGAANYKLSIQDQVMGRSPAALIQLLLEEEALKHLVECVRKDFSGTGIRYWASPVVFDGEIK